MPGVASWVRDVLVSRGALVEMQEGETLRALLPAQLAHALGTGEWLSLDFGAGAGADNPGDWLDRLAPLLRAAPGNPFPVAAARLVSPAPAPAIDAAAVLERHLAVQNGISRLVADGPASASYFFFRFQYTLESDERSVGFLTVALNATARCRVPEADHFRGLVWERLEESPQLQPSAAELAAIYSLAAVAARTETRKLVASVESSANRRLARDTERVEAYYRGLLAQIHKRLERAADPQAAEKERTRAQATELDRAAKLEDLRRKHSLRVHVEPADALVVLAPAREIRARLIRKKEERLRTFHWNVVLHRLEPALCEHCLTGAQPLCLCEKMHCLCKVCWAPCARCGKPWCPVCLPGCKCGTASASAPSPDSPDERNE